MGPPLNTNNKYADTHISTHADEHAVCDFISTCAKQTKGVRTAKLSGTKVARSNFVKCLRNPSGSEFNRKRDECSKLVVFVGKSVGISADLIALAIKGNSGVALFNYVALP